MTVPCSFKKMGVRQKYKNIDIYYVIKDITKIKLL